MKVRPAILIIKDHKILTMQYHYGGQDVYNLPGGNLELFETMATTLEREMVEELGIEVAVGKLAMIGEVVNLSQQKSTLHAVFEGEIKAGIPTLNPKETSALNIVWLPIKDLKQYNMYPNIAHYIELFEADNLKNPYIGTIEQPWF